MNSREVNSFEVEFKDVHKNFNSGQEKVHVIKGVTGSVTRGKILTMIGPSGSGKSTILSLCNLLLTPDEGEIYINGKEVRDWDRQQLRTYVGMVFQSAPMITGTARHNLELPKKLKGETLTNPEKFMELVHLEPELLNREAKELSGGQKQRLSLARTLVNNPAILLLDEVTSALDRHSSREIEELIVQLNKKNGLTILWVTHDLHQAKRVGDETWFVKDGKVIEKGLTEKIFHDPEHEETKKFLSLKRENV